MALHRFLSFSPHHTPVKYIRFLTFPYLDFNQVKCPVQGQGCVGTSTPLCRLGSELLVAFPRVRSALK